MTGALGLGPHQFAITEETTLLGSIALRVGKHETGYVGYWCETGARGRSITTRALRRVCRYGLGDLALERLELTADVENLASQRVAERSASNARG